MPRCGNSNTNTQFDRNPKRHDNCIPHFLAELFSHGERFSNTRTILHTVWFHIIDIHRSAHCDTSCAASAAISGSAWPSNPTQWASSIDAYARSDRVSPPASGGIVFVGSSTIRLWATRLTTDFPGLGVVGRGFGGSWLPDSTYFASRIVSPYRPRQVLLFSGSNDIAGGRSAAEVAADFRFFVSVVRCLSPTARISFLEITSSPSRWSQRDRVVAANALIRNFTAADAGVDFIPARGLFLTADGSATRRELFADDLLHLSPAGYNILAQAVRPFLLPVVPAS